MHAYVYHLRGKHGVGTEWRFDLIYEKEDACKWGGGYIHMYNITFEQSMELGQSDVLHVSPIHWQKCVTWRERVYSVSFSYLAELY